MFKKMFVLLPLSLLVAACSGNPIDTIRVYVNRNKVEQCRPDPAKCAGGYVVFRDTTIINRITRNRDGEGIWTVDATRLVSGMDIEGDTYLNQIQDVVLVDEERWEKFAVQYARQFVTR